MWHNHWLHRDISRRRKILRRHIHHERLCFRSGGGRRCGEGGRRLQGKSD